MEIFYTPSCQADFNLVATFLCQGNPQDIIIGKTLGTGDYNLKMGKID